MVGNADFFCPPTSLNRILLPASGSAGAQNLDFTEVPARNSTLSPRTSTGVTARKGASRKS